MTLSLTRAASAKRHHKSPRPRLMRYLAVWQQRRALANMTPERLDDLGLSRADAAREVRRPFWDIPEK